jgi:hypothetical protein
MFNGSPTQMAQISDNIRKFDLSTNNNKSLSITYSWFHEDGLIFIVYLQCKVGTGLNLVNLMLDNFSKFQRIQIDHPNEQYNTILRNVVLKVEQECSLIDDGLADIHEIYRLVMN